MRQSRKQKIAEHHGCHCLREKSLEIMFYKDVCAAETKAKNLQKK